MSRLRSYQDCQDYLYGRINYEKKPDVPYTKNFFKLDRMRELARRLGDPHEKLLCVHVAGTKGKGSTSAMLAAMLTGAGYRTGLFTSPHLTHLEERFRIDGEPVSRRTFVSLVQAVAPHVDAMTGAGAARFNRPTYFETITAMALLHFARRQVDAAVFEVGLGGRLDSTNIITPAVSVITSISRDHTRQLGTTLAAIAAEKAGIIKPGVPVVSGVARPTARAVIRRRCRELGSPLYEASDQWVRRYRLSPARRGRAPVAEAAVRANGRLWPSLPLRLLGEHQARNCALAIAALELLGAHGVEVTADQAAAGLAALEWPGRLEVLERRPWLVVDGAHNPASFETLEQTVGQAFPRLRRVLIVGAAADKDIRAMLRIAAPGSAAIVATQSANPRAATAEAVAAAARRLGHKHVHVEPTAADALARARELAEPRDLILAAGSFILAGEIRELALEG